MELYEKSAHELSEMLSKKECSSEEITLSVLDRAEATEPQVGAYLTKGLPSRQDTRWRVFR